MFSPFLLGFDFSADYESGEVTGNTDMGIEGGKLGFFGGLLLTVITGSIVSLMVALTLINMGILTLKQPYLLKNNLVYALIIAQNPHYPPHCHVQAVSNYPR